MFALVISKEGKGDFCKVSFDKEKLYSVVREEIDSYMKMNKGSLEQTLALSTLNDALSIKDFESAMDLFGTVTEENGSPIFLVIMKAEIIHDA